MKKRVRDQKTLVMFQLNASVFRAEVMKTDEDWW